MIDINALKPVSSATLANNPLLISDDPGFYAVFFDSGTCLLEGSGYLDFDQAYPPAVEGFDLLYVGATLDSLRRRALQHVVGDSRSSSLRMTVGALLANDLDLEPVGDGSRTYFNFGDGERRLTSWLCAHTRVAVHPSSQPFVLEKALLREHFIPFNLSERKRHPFSKYLMALRAVYAGRSSNAAHLSGTRLNQARLQPPASSESV